MNAYPSELPVIDPVVPKKKVMAFNDPDWLFELKYDGFRGVLYHENGRVRLMSRSGKHLSQFGELERFLTHCLPKQDLILDGEVVSLDASGRPLFDDLRQKHHRGILTYMAFDMLWRNGKDLRPLPLRKRREMLHRFVQKKAKGCIRTAFGVVGKGTRLFESIVDNDLEGVVAKRLESAYMKKTQWWKILNPDYSRKHH